MNIKIPERVKENEVYKKMPWYGQMYVQLAHIFAVAMASLVGIILSPLFLLLYLHTLYIENKLRKEFMNLQRYLSEQDLLEKIQQTKGTFIWQRTYNFARLWWTSDDIPSISPFPICSKLQWLKSDSKKDPFVLWCHNKYLDKNFGCAFLVGLGKNDKSDFVLKNLPTVVIPFVDDLHSA
jgi:hypothetical protein